MKTLIYVILLVLVAMSVVSAAAPSKVTLEVKDKQIKEVVDSISSQSGVSIILDPKVKGNITVNLRDTELSQVLDIITKINGGAIWKKLQFVKQTDSKVALEQLQSAMLALASMPVLGLSVEDPTAKTSSLYAKDLPKSPDVSTIALPEGYSWVTVYVLMPSEQALADAKTVSASEKVKSLSEIETKRMIEMANMSTEERKQIFANEWSAQMSMTPEARQALLRDRISAMFSLDPQYQQQIRQDMREAFRGMPQMQRPGGGGGRQGGGQRQNNNNNNNNN